MAELCNIVFQYIGFKPNEIRLPITEEDKQLFHKIISDQKGMADIVMGDYQFLLQYGHNGKGDNQIYIEWLLICIVANAEKILINLPKDLSEKLLAYIKKRFKEVLLVPVFIW